MLNLSIHKASPADIPVIRDLALQIWPATYQAILTPGQVDYMLNLFYSEDSLREQMGHTRFIIVKENDIPVGFASYGSIEPGVYKLNKIYVLLSQQGKGTGRYIIGQVVNDIRLLGASRLQLNVNRFNRARDFYKKLGFAVIGEEDIDIGNGYYMNDYVMEMNLEKEP